jgi:hypothetical protein
MKVEQLLGRVERRPQWRGERQKPAFNNPYTTKPGNKNRRKADI